MENIQLQQPSDVISVFANPFGPEKLCTDKMLCASVQEVWAECVSNYHLHV